MKTKTILITTLLLGFFAFAKNSQATNHYIRQGASGDGSDWTNAYGNLPDELIRGDTYYVADGSYDSYTFDDANSGTQIITVKKSIVLDHGTDIGWQASYGDGQAVFGGILLIQDYLVFDGQVRNESNWADGDAYGFRADEFYSNEANFGRCSKNISIKYVNIGGTFQTTYDANQPSQAIYFGGFGDVCSNWTISRVFAHNVGIVGQMASVDNITWEYSWLGLNWSKEIIRGQIRASNVSIHHNIFKDGCRDDHAPGTGCTAEIAFFGNYGSYNENYDNARIYGNVIWKTITQHNSDGCILVQNGNSGVIHNNTIVKDAGSGMCRLSLEDGVNSAIFNNIWYLPEDVITGCQSVICSDNSVYNLPLSPFVNTISGDFHLAQPIAGSNLSSPYNTDMFGNVRGADGVWDRGALEYVSGSAGDTTAPASPGGLTVR